MMFLLLLQEAAAALPEPALESDAFDAPDIGRMVILLAALGIAPFVLAMATSFARLVIIGGLLRQALGLQQIPPTSVLTGLALVLTVHIMSPVIEDAWSGWQAASDTEGRVRAVHDAGRAFLTKKARDTHVLFFKDLRAEQDRSRSVDPSRTPLDPEAARMLETFTVYLPAFVLSELTAAFTAGFLIFIPFLVLDLVVSNILLALGMHMLSPITVSLPLKILLFVTMDGWTLVLEGVVRSYHV